MTAQSVRPQSRHELSAYARLAAEIRDLGLMRPRIGFYTAVLVLTLLALALVVAVMALVRDSWWLLFLAPPLAVVSVQMGFFGHDAGHRQVSRKAGPSRWLGLFAGNMINGFSYDWWVTKHNAHHAHPNDLEADPDVRSGALVFDSSQAMGRRGASAWLARHQAWFFFPMLTLEALNLHISSVRALLSSRARHRGSEAAFLVGHFVLYGMLLVLTMTWTQALVFIAIHKGLSGVYLGSSFAPNHKGMPVLTGEQAADPLLRQVLTSRNVRGGPVVDVALGGLNYQIEHHLFPSMPRPNLRHAQPVVRAFCERHGVSYEETSLWASYAIVLRHLDTVADPSAA
ncbi:MAG: acyl-CoA desaturase [Nocardioides sp.]